MDSLSARIANVRRLVARDVVVAAGGLGIGIVLYGLLVWSPTTLLASDGAAAFAFAGYLGSTANALTFGAAAAFARMARTGQAAARARTMRTATVALLVACIVAWAAAFAVVPGSHRLCLPIAALAVVVAGMAVSLTFVQWMVRLSALPAAQARLCLVLAAAISALCNIPNGFLSLPALRGAVLVLLAAETALLLARHAFPATADSGRPGSVEGEAADNPPSRTRDAVADIAPVLVAAVVVAFVAPLVNTVLMADALEVPARLKMSALMNLATAAALFVLWFATKKAPGVFAVLLGFTLVLFGAVVLSWLIGPQANALVLGLGSAGFFLTIYLVADASMDVARRRGIDPVVVYGTAAGLAMLARVGADAFSAQLLNSGIASESKLLIAAFLLVYLLTCVAFLLFGAIVRRRAPAMPDKLAGACPKTSDGQDALQPTPRPERRDALRERCDAIADAYRLSQREREVLTLMMRGRNVPAIADELVLSRNTVQTHVRHVYEQLDIHSRRELVAFVEAWGQAGIPL